MPHATVRHPNHEQSQRNRLRRPLLVDLRAGTAVHRHAAPRRFFTVRGVDLPLGRRLGGAAALRAGDGPAAAHRPQGLRRRLPAEPLPGRLFAEPRLRLCQHRHRRRFDHSFPLSAGRRAGHDALFPRTLFAAAVHGHRRFARRRRTALVGRHPFERRRRDVRHRRGLFFGDLLRGLSSACARAAPHKSNRRPSRCWSWPSAPRCSQRRAA